MTAVGTEFMDGALCVQFDPDVFAGDRPDLTASAQRICSQCPVRPECGEYEAVLFPGVSDDGVTGSE